MVITREQLIRKLAEETGFWQKDMRIVFDKLGDVMLEYFNMATEEENIFVQVFEGCKIGCNIIPERTRIHPTTREEITCKPTVKPAAKFSVNFRNTIQENYDKKMAK